MYDYYTELKVRRRLKMVRAVGEQGGTVYARHREKVNRSGGYLRKGNLTHYMYGRRHRKGFLKSLRYEDDRVRTVREIRQAFKEIV